MCTQWKMQQRITALLCAGTTEYCIKQKVRQRSRVAPLHNPPRTCSIPYLPIPATTKNCRKSIVSCDSNAPIQFFGAGGTKVYRTARSRGGIRQIQVIFGPRTATHLPPSSLCNPFGHKASPQAVVQGTIRGLTLEMRENP